MVFAWFFGPKVTERASLEPVATAEAEEARAEARAEAEEAKG